MSSFPRSIRPEGFPKVQSSPWERRDTDWQPFADSSRCLPSSRHRPAGSTWGTCASSVRVCLCMNRWARMHAGRRASTCRSCHSAAELTGRLRHVRATRNPDSYWRTVAEIPFTSGLATLGSLRCVRARDRHTHQRTVAGATLCRAALRARNIKTYVTIVLLTLYSTWSEHGSKVYSLRAAFKNLKRNLAWQAGRFINKIIKIKYVYSISKRIWNFYRKE